MPKFIVDPVIGGGGITTNAIPTAASVGAGTQYWDSSYGTGTLLTSDGTVYSQLNPMRLIAQSGIPLILPSSGTLTAGGALSGIVALASIYPSCWMFFPANAVATVSAAGMYFVQMSSTTAGTVFQNILTSGVPTIPAASALIPCTTASNYTQTVGSNITVALISLPANCLGANGRCRISGNFSNATSANSKFGQLGFGSTSIAGAGNTTNLAQPVMHDITNRGVTNSQVNLSATGYLVAASAPAQGAVDTTAAVNVSFFLQNTVAAQDSCQWDFILVEVFPQP